jgi:hypothetical protein
MEKKDLLKELTVFNGQVIGWLGGLIVRGTDPRPPTPPPPPPVNLNDLRDLMGILQEFQANLVALGRRGAE